MATTMREIPEQKTESRPPTANPHFVSSLDDVAEALDIKRPWIIKLRDEEQCPALQERPYDVDAIRDWLMQRAKIANEPLARKKLEAEVRKIEAEAKGEEAKHTFWSRDKMFWLAVLGMGIPVGERVAAWLQKEIGEDEPPKHEGWLVSRGMELKKLDPKLADTQAVKRFVDSVREAGKDGRPVLICSKDPLPVFTVITNTKHDFRIRRVALADPKLREIIDECLREKNPLVITDGGKDLFFVRPDESMIDWAPSLPVKNNQAGH